MTTNTTSLKFRRATVQDAAALETLINIAFRDDHTTEVFLSTDHSTIDVTSAASIAAKIAQPDTAVLVVEDLDDGALVAHCSVRLMEDGSTAWFGLLAVDVDRKNQGLGSQVLAYAEDYAYRELGARRMEFDVVNTRVTLRAWYTKRGYSLTGQRLPFPYGGHGEWHGVLRDDLEFVLFGKDLVGQSAMDGF
ncbi:unnamed protein product [Discula destructiva]